MALTPVDNLCAQLLERQDRRNRFFWNNQSPERRECQLNKRLPVSK